MKVKHKPKASADKPKKRPRRQRGAVLVCGLIGIVIAILVGATWLFLLRAPKPLPQTKPAAGPVYMGSIRASQSDAQMAMLMHYCEGGSFECEFVGWRSVKITVRRADDKLIDELCNLALTGMGCNLLYKTPVARWK